jgi:hypothetical protein
MSADEAAYSDLCKAAVRALAEYNGLIELIDAGDREAAALALDRTASEVSALSEQLRSALYGDDALTDPEVRRQLENELVPAVAFPLADCQRLFELVEAMN